MFLKRVVERLKKRLGEVSWASLAAATVGLWLACWGLYAAFEPPGSEVATLRHSWWFFVVCATSVGFGDMSPTSLGGQVTAVVLNMGGGLGLMGAVVGKAAVDVNSVVRKKMQGKGDYSALSGHIVLFGWRGERTRDMLANMFADAGETRDVVLCSSRAEEHPVRDMADRVHFVRGENLGGEDVVRRAGVANASCVLIDGHSDDQALAVGVACTNAMGSDGRLVAYFSERRYASLLEGMNPSAEAVVAVSGDLLVRALQDRGSSKLAGSLLASDDGATQYSFVVPEAVWDVRYGDVVMGLLKSKGVTLIGMARGDDPRQISASPAPETCVEAGDRLYYIGATRVSHEDVDWKALQAA